MVAVTAVVSIVGLTACTDGTDVPSDVEATVEADRPSKPVDERGEGWISLGDLNKPQSAAEVGSPFDPCALAWTDFPVAVRPTDGKPHPPTARVPEPDDPYEVRCLYDNSGAITLNREGKRTGSAGGVFMVSVVWSAGKLDADPRKREGATAKSWNDRTGLVATFTDRKHGKGCLGLVTLSKGVAGVSVTNSRFTGAEPCEVVDSVLNAVIAKAS